MGDWFDELYEKRRSWVDITRRNKFEDGVWQSTVEKYADPAHFVYELLQNAEDQGATSASFRLAPDRLAFEHNGSAFTRDDVENITGLGNTDKPEEANKIGRFGIGFKSVFVVTDSPRVYATLENEPFGFEIRDLVVPTLISCPEGYLPTGRTRFILPFRDQGGAAVHDTIATRLQQLGADTLLFLRHLTEITWDTLSNEGTYLCERNECRQRVTLVGEAGPKGRAKQTEETEYALYSREVTVDGVDDRKLRVSIAFRMHDGRIVPEPGQPVLNVYFPTEERAGLRFRLHAPFLLTDNRGNLKRGEVINTQLIEASAALLGETLPKLRDQGLLTTDALSCLPIRYERKKDYFSLPDEDEEPEERSYDIAEADGFEPFFRAVRDALIRDPLLPTDDGQYVAGRDAKLARSDAVRKLLGEPELAELFGASRALRWLSTQITEDRTPGLRAYLRDVIGVGEVDPEAFASRLSADFLASRSDDWIRQLYEFLLDQEALWGRDRQRPLLRSNRTRPIIRLQDGSHVAPFREDGKIANAYLPPECETPLPVVRRTLCQGAARDFLVRLGLGEPDLLVSVLEVTLPRYGTEAPQVPWADYLHDMRQIGRAAATCASTRQAELRSVLTAASFIAATNAADASILRYRKPTEVYLAVPDIRVWFEANGEAWFIHPAVTSLPDWKAICDYIPTYASVRFRCTWASADGHTVLIDDHGRHARGRDGFDPRAKLEGLEHALENMTLPKAQILWDLLLKNTHLVRGVVEFARRRNFDNAESRIQRSYAGELCARRAWMPDASGAFRTASELHLEELHASLARETDAARLLAEALGMLKPLMEQAAQVLGVRAADLAEFVELYQRDADSVRGFLAAQRRPAFPERSSPDPTRRAEKVRQRTSEAAAKTYETRSRSVRTSQWEVSEGTREYLRDLYTNDDDQLICQICEEAMPFRLDQGRGPFYFEAVECIRVVSKECQENQLALCPTCAAMYRHANDTTPEDLGQAIMDATDLEVPIVLAGEDAAIRFVETHLLDLQTVLRTTDAGSELDTIDLEETDLPTITDDV